MRSMEHLDPESILSGESQNYCMSFIKPGLSFDLSTCLMQSCLFIQSDVCGYLDRHCSQLNLLNYRGIFIGSLCQGNNDY